MKELIDDFWKLRRECTLPASDLAPASLWGRAFHTSLGTWWVVYLHKVHSSQGGGALECDPPLCDLCVVGTGVAHSGDERLILRVHRRTSKTQGLEATGPASQDTAFPDTSWCSELCVGVGAGMQVLLCLMRGELVPCTAPHL